MKPHPLLITLAGLIIPKRYNADYSYWDEHWAKTPSPESPVYLPDNNRLIARCTNPNDKIIFTNY